MKRCWWPGEDELYVRYHDQEWGRPVTDDRRLFEKICLEGFQSGLTGSPSCASATTSERPSRTSSRRTSRASHTRRRSGSERRRHRPAPRQDSNRRFNNAKRALELAGAGSLAAYFWSWEPDAKSAETASRERTRFMSSTDRSVALSKDQEARLTLWAPRLLRLMQAMGLVNDHVDDCYVRPEVERARNVFQDPSPRPRPQDPRPKTQVPGPKSQSPKPPNRRVARS